MPWARSRAPRPDGRSVEGLRSRIEPKVTVRRDGAWVEVPGTDLVEGDLLRLEAGDRVPADLQVATADLLAVDESVLTRESLPVTKALRMELSAGTLAVRGRATAEVLRKGPRSAMGRLSGLLGGIQDETTPLDRRLRNLAGRIARVVLVLAALLLAFGLATEGLAAFQRIFLFAAALAVAAVPEGLPAVLTLTLARGVQRMARRKAVVRRLSAVEALRSVAVIATDKTGTLTENRLEVQGVDAGDPEEARVAMALANDAEPGILAGDPGTPPSCRPQGLRNGSRRSGPRTRCSPAGPSTLGPGPCT
jgi:Ca2+-transporting ATPase